MGRPQIGRTAISAFEAAKAASSMLPDVEAAIRYDGAPVLRAQGRFMAGLAIHPSVEPDTLVVRIDPDARALLLEEAPDTYYLTDPYRAHPVVLVRLSCISADALRDLLAAARRLTVTRRIDLDGGAGVRRRCARSVHTHPPRGRR